MLALLLAACGDDESVPAGADAGAADATACVDPADMEPVDGLLATPGALSRDGCEPGSLAGFDPSGLWYLTEQPHSKWTRGPVRFSLSCGGGLTVAQSNITDVTEVGQVQLTANDLFWRSEQTFGENFRYVEAYTVCNVNADGTLSGHHSSCYFGDFGESCGEAPFTAAPFGRIAGESDADGLELVSTYRGGDQPWEVGFAANVRVVDGVAYLAMGRDGLRIVDVSDPAAPVEIGHYPAESDNFNDVKIVDGPDDKRYAIMGSAAFGAMVIDVTDPASPQMITVFTPSGQPQHGVHTLFTETIDAQTRAYIVDGGGPQLGIYDVSDPANPVRLGGYTSPNEDWGFHDLYVENGRVHGNATAGGMLVIDTLDDPANPTLLGQFRMDPDTDFSHSNWVTTAGGRKISIHGEEGWGASIQIVDVDPASETFMEQIGSFALRDEVSVHNIMAFGDRAYVAYYQDGVRVLDLSDPTAPTEIAHYNTWDPATAPGGMFEGVAGIDVDLDKGLIYLTDTPGGLVILRLME